MCVKSNKRPNLVRGAFENKGGQTVVIGLNNQSAACMSTWAHRWWEDQQGCVVFLAVSVVAVLNKEAARFICD
jgi:hypothetical protein